MAQKSMALRANEVKLEELSFSDVRSIGSNGAKMVFINLKGGSLYLQTPELDVPFDCTFYPDGNDENGKINVNVSLKGFNEISKVKEFHDLLLNFDDLIKQKCVENSVSWHKKAKMSMETVDSLYTNMVKLSIDSETGEPDGKYPPQFRYKISKKNNKWECAFYDQNRQPLDVEDVERVLKKGTKTKALLKCTAVWFAGGKFGCSWRAEQLIVNAPKTLDDYAFRSDDENEGEEPDEQKSSVNDLVDTTSEEEEEEEEEDEEEEAEPVVVKKKKGGKGK
tara:strand:- start:24 stop:860 length:837 start_codon:yes stop_codon:yes gene_type:complete